MNLLERTVHAGKWDYSVIKPVFAIRNKVLGLMGCGNIARGVVKKAQAFGMKVIGYDPFLPQNVFDEFGIERVENLDDLLAQADFVNIQLHHSAATDKIVNADFLHKMKPTAYLINTSRGQVIREQDLAEALNGGKLSGAAMDVLCEEPPKKGNPLTHCEKCLITPHISWAAKESRDRLLHTVCDNVEAFLKGTPQNQVN